MKAKLLRRIRKQFIVGSYLSEQDVRFFVAVHKKYSNVIIETDFYYDFIDSVLSYIGYSEEDILRLRLKTSSYKRRKEKERDIKNERQKQYRTNILKLISR